MVYSKPEPGDEIVITGMSGKLPDCNDLYHFRDNLFNKVDMVSKDHRRWKPTNPEVPHRIGKLANIDKFDAGFFGIPKKHSDYMDPMCRMVLERVYEALVDAGHHPFDLEGTNTKVYVGLVLTETERFTYSNNITKSDGVTGCNRSMIAKRINYFFKLNGTGYALDTACSTSLCTLEEAYQDLRAGNCDKALVCATNVLLYSNISLQFGRLGVLSRDGVCRSFDDAGNGYVRSEAIMAILLEKSKDAKRAYAEIIHCKVNCDGYKDEGLTFPSSEMQTVLMRELYSECHVDPTSVTFIEAHGTGTKVGDPVELSSIDKCFCKGRSKPLHIGTAKSNMGHTEPVSGIASVAKVVLGFESGFIPPNINYFTPRKGVEALEKGRLVVVTEKIPWPSNNCLVGINSFGFGGANAHTLLRWNPKVKINNGIPLDDIPRLVCASGRSEDTIASILDGASKMDAEFINLVHGVFRKIIPNQLYSGFAIIHKMGEMERLISHNKFTKNRLRIVFSNADQKWYRLGEKLMEIPLYFNLIHRIQKTLEKELSITISKLLAVTNGIFAAVIVQLTLADMIKELNLEIHEIIGVGFGGLVAAYLDGFLLLEDVLLATYFIFSENTKKVKDLLERKPFQPNKWISHCDMNENIRFTHQGSWNNFMNSVLNPKSPEQISKEIIEKNHFVNVIIGPWNESCRDNDIMMIGNGSESTVELLRSLGRLFLMGFPANLDKLYPVIAYPVSKGTSMLSPFIKWEHSRSYKVACEDTLEGGSDSKRLQPVLVLARTENWKFITGHVIDGRNLFPATGFLTLVWERYANILGRLMSNTNIVFEDVKFHRAANVPRDGILTFNINFQTDNKSFEIIENGTVLVTGLVYSFNEEQVLTNARATSKYSGVMEMNERDIYKELRLRGYHYNNQFKGIKSYNFKTNTATIHWNDNWASFMDNMLQVHLLNEDTRNLNVITGIKKLMIDVIQHFQETVKYDNHLPIIYDKNARLIAGGGIEISQVVTTNIFRRYPPEPLLEIYKFVPYKGKLEFDQAMRCIIQIIIENTNSIQVKSVEVLDESKKEEPITPLVQQVLDDLPLIRSELKILSNEENLHLPGIVVENQSLENESGCLISILSDVLNNQELLSKALKATRDVSGFIVTKECKAISAEPNEQIQVLASYDTEKGSLLLIKESSKYTERIPINISSIDELSWVEKLKPLINSNVLLYTEKNLINGALGLVNCLHTEYSENNLLAMLIMDNAPPFNVDDEFYKSQLKKNLIMNVYKDGNWGSYRHLLLPPVESVLSEHIYANVTVKGNLNSMRWMQGSSSMTPPDSETELIQVHYSGINFKDVLLASGRLSDDNITSNRKAQERLQGLEYSGILARDPSQRMMGIVMGGALSTMVTADKNLLWSVPNEWSLEDAATVPIVYATVLYAFIKRGKMKRGQTVLIHSGTGGVGQAAINVATYFGCTIFTTVSTQEKREFIRKNFPQIRDEHIGDSRSTSFEVMIHKETQGKGVDFVLNSLVEEKLQASIRCLAHNGTFLEIGKFDLIADKQLPFMLFKKQARYEGIMIDQFFERNNETKGILMELIKDGISNGSVKPLIRTVFHKDKIGEAYRYMSTGKHIGKILIKIREYIAPLFNAIPRMCCNLSASYIIIGGLGGLGLELADWLMLRGANNLILTSRNGITNGFQFYRLNIFKSYGVNVFIRNDDITTEEGCKALLTFAEGLGPVDGIFNLAVVLKDGLFENQTVETFETSLKPKAYATRHLDVVSRDICPKLRYFVVFSSVFCGRGNPGQTSYGMANSVMERICEKRKIDGFPGLAIQWGVVEDAGLVAEMTKDHTELPIRGVGRQRVSNCLKVFDQLLLQDEAIVSSIIVAEKQNKSTSNNMFDTVLNIIGITNLNTVSMHTTFAELGMDSMIAFEIKQTLDQNYQKFLSIHDVRHLTIMKLQNLAANQDNVISASNQNSLEGDIPENIKLILQHIGNEELLSKSIIEMNTSKDISEHATPVFDKLLSQEAKKQNKSVTNMFDTVLNIMGITNINTVSMHATFAELGMDSMMAIEIKQTLDQNYAGVLSTHAIRDMTITKLQSLIDNQDVIVSAPNQNVLEGDINEELLNKSITECSDISEHVTPVFALAGVEETDVIYKNLRNKLNLSSKLICLEFCTGNSCESIEQIAEPLVKIVDNFFSNNFVIIAYSFGCVIATELMYSLESLGKIGKALFIDGASDMLIQSMQGYFPLEDDEAFQVTLLCALMNKYIPLQAIMQYKGDIAKWKSFEEKIKFILSIFPIINHSEEYIIETWKTTYNRIKSLGKYKPRNIKLNSKITLVKPAVRSLMDVAEDYNLSALTKYPVKLKVIEGNHVSMLQSEQLVSEMKAFLRG